MIFRYFNLFKFFLAVYLICFIKAQGIKFRSEYASEGCQTSSGLEGVCLEIKYCPHAIENIAEGVRPVHCGFKGKIPIVCCPLYTLRNLTSRLTKPGDISAPLTSPQGCGYRGFVEYDSDEPKIRDNPAFPSGDLSLHDRTFFSTPGDFNPQPNPFDTPPNDFNPQPNPFDYPNINFDTQPNPINKPPSNFKPGPSPFDHPPNMDGEVPLSTVDPLVFSISHGVHAFRNSWPWMALLGRQKGRRVEFFCSAVLINENYVITAAHCVLIKEIIFVRFGEHDYNPDQKRNIHEKIEDVWIKSFIFHPQYDVNRGYYDIALLQLERNVTYRSEVGPICLPWAGLANEPLVGEKVTVAGWGTEEFGGIPSSILQEVNVTVFHPSVCHESYSTLADFNDLFPDGLGRQKIVCAGDSDGGKDACEGDSGGPLMHYDKEKDNYSLAGIVSKGYGCGRKGFPGLYAPLRNKDTLFWIKKTAF